MTNLAAQLQAIQATASEDGTISAAALNDVINALKQRSRWNDWRGRFLHEQLF